MAQPIALLRATPQAEVDVIGAHLCSITIAMNFARHFLDLLLSPPDNDSPKIQWAFTDLMI